MRLTRCDRRVLGGTAALVGDSCAGLGERVHGVRADPQARRRFVPLYERCAFSEESYSSALAEERRLREP